MIKLDVTQTNDAVDRLLAVTTNPRHRFMLLAYHRHRFLEIAGRYEEIFAPDMMVAEPVYHFKLAGVNATLKGADAVKGLYGLWAQSHQSVFYIESEQIAVADNFIASVTTAYQQLLGQGLIENGITVDDPHAYYLYKMKGVQMIWPYDDRCRLVGEDVWEPDPDAAEITKLDPADVLSTEQCARLLAPLIKPLPAYDEFMRASAIPA
jgi:hypothetical protein